VLTEADYPNLIEQGRPVATVTFANALMATNKPTGSSRERLLAFFAETVLSRAGDLKRPGHNSKWRDFDVHDEIPNWKRNPAVTRWLAREGEITGFTSGSGRAKQPDPGTVGIPPSSHDQLFQQFLEWREQQRKKEQRK